MKIMNKIIRLSRIQFGNEILIRITYKHSLFRTITNRDAYCDGSTVLSWKFCDTNKFTFLDSLLNFFYDSGETSYIINGENKYQNL